MEACTPNIALSVCQMMLPDCSFVNRCSSLTVPSSKHTPTIPSSKHTPSPFHRQTTPSPNPFIISILPYTTPTYHQGSPKPQPLHITLPPYLYPTKHKIHTRIPALAPYPFPFLFPHDSFVLSRMHDPYPNGSHPIHPLSCKELVPISKEANL